MEAGVNITVILLIVFICLKIRSHLTSARGALQLRALLWRSSIGLWPLVDYGFNICSKRARCAYILHTDY